MVFSQTEVSPVQTFSLLPGLGDGLGVPEEGYERENVCRSGSLVSLRLSFYGIFTHPVSFSVIAHFLNSSE